MPVHKLQHVLLDNQTQLSALKSKFTPGQFLLPLLSRKGIRTNSTKLFKFLSKSKPFFRGRTWGDTRYVGNAFDHTSLSLSLWPDVQGANLLLLRQLFHGSSRPCYVDVGANGGMYAANIAKFLSGKGHVIGFEANLQLAQLAAATAALNNLDNVQIFSAAISDTAGTIQLHIVPEQSGSSSVLSDHLAKEFGTDQSKIKTLDVPCFKIDDVLPDMAAVSAADRIVLKVDVEGHEKSVFAGGAEFIRRFKPYLFFEWNRQCAAQAGDSLESLTTYLNSLCRYDFTAYQDAGGQTTFPPPADISPLNIAARPVF
ncbi:MAG: FkbM family methyltransferase [Phycisphaerae bacterium]